MRLYQFKRYNPVLWITISVFLGLALMFVSSYIYNWVITPTALTFKYGSICIAILTVSRNSWAGFVYGIACFKKKYAQK